MTTSTTQSGAGRALAERLGLSIMGTEGHDLKCGCRFCGSSDAGRLHADTGCYFCFSCQRALSPFDLCKIKLGDHEQAIRMMVSVGLFEDRSGNGQPVGTTAVGPDPSSNGDQADDQPPGGVAVNDDVKSDFQSPIDPIERWATAKGTTADGFRAFGAKPMQSDPEGIKFPLFDVDGKSVSAYTLTTGAPKGLYAKGKPWGLFLPFPGKQPAPGERWLIVEGVKDAAALWSIGYHNTAGLPGNHLPQKFGPLFDGVDVTLLPDSDEPGLQGTKTTVGTLADHATAVRIARLPAEVKESHGADVRDVLRDQGADAIRRAIDGAKPAADGARFPIVSSLALDSEDYTARPIITEVLFEGSPAVIGGMFKTGKTLLGIDAAVSIATGRMFLGAWTVPEPHGVVYFTGEGGPAVSQEYGRRIATSKGIALSDVTRLHWCFSVPRLEDLRDLDAFAKVLEKTDAEVIVLDNLMLCLSGDNAGNVYSMGSVLGNVVRICSERGCTPIFVHHFKRTRATADPFAPGELTDLTQAGVAEIAGQWILLARREAYSPADPGEHQIWMTAGGRMGHSSLTALDIHEGSRADPGGRRWEVEVLRPEDVKQQAADGKQAQRQAKQQETLEADRREIVQAAVKLKAPESKTALREMVSCGHTRFGRAFASLVAEDVLQPATVTKANGQTYGAWKVRNDQET